MHALLLTLMALGAGADASHATGRFSQSSAEIYQAKSLGAPANSGCDTCNQSACGGNCGKQRCLAGNQLGGWFGHMPQTCYDPRYGCYQGSGRFMHRYPAFSGTYYRRPYNYRNVFDYPWHAGMHEPTSLFSYNTPPESGATNVQDIGSPGLSPITAPTPMYESARRMTPRPQGSGVSSPYVGDQTSPRANPATTLRR